MSRLVEEVDCSHLVVEEAYCNLLVEEEVYCSLLVAEEAYCNLRVVGVVLHCRRSCLVCRSEGLGEGDYNYLFVVAAVVVFGRMNDGLSERVVRLPMLLY